MSEPLLNLSGLYDVARDDVIGQHAGRIVRIVGGAVAGLGEDAFPPDLAAIATKNPDGVYRVPSASQWEGESAYHAKAASNPFTKQHFNLTEQLRLGRENPTLAARLKAVADE